MNNLTDTYQVALLVRLQESIEKGFIVKTDKPINENSFICGYEYSKDSNLPFKYFQCCFRMLPTQALMKQFKDKTVDYRTRKYKITAVYEIVR